MKIQLLTLFFASNLILAGVPRSLMAAQPPDPLALEQERRIKDDAEQKWADVGLP